MDKSLGISLHGLSLNYTYAAPLSSWKTILDACIDSFFRVLTLYRVGEGNQQDIFEMVALFYGGTYELQEITNAASLCQEGLSNINL